MKSKTLFNYTIGAAAFLLITVSACKKENEELSTPSSSEPTELERKGHWKNSSTEFYLLNGNNLDKFNSSQCHSSSPSPTHSATITGLQPGENILAIDFRPATGELYGLGSSSRIYIINPHTGLSRVVGNGAFTPALSGTVAAFDFNPTVDRIRVVTSTGQNFRINPETGAVAGTDGNINGQAGAMISAVAYSNNYAGAATTTLYDIDPASNKLFRQDPPNAGTLVNVGSLNLDVQGDGGFDISPKGAALGIFKVNNITTLFEVNLYSGDADVKATFPGKNYNGIAFPTAAVAYAATSNNELLIFGLHPYNSYGNQGCNNTNVITKQITGLAAGESIKGLDMRPLNGQLYALGSNSNIYTVNASSGLATLAFPLSTALAGSDFGFDFNPAVDRIRIVSNSGQNLRFNPITGAVLVDSTLNPGSPAVSAAAYNNNFAGTASTTLFVIDFIKDKLYQVTPPNAGTLVLVGHLGINILAANGFDIGSTSNNAYVVSKTGSSTKLYKINTTSGHASYHGSLGNFPVSGFTIGLGF